MSTLILVREGFSHMSDVSGFDPLCQQLSAISPDVESLFVNHESLSGLHHTPVQRLLKKLSRKRSQPCSPFNPSACPSPFTGEIHHLIGHLLLAKLTTSPQAKSLVSFGENQYAACLASAEPAIRKRLIVCMHQPPSWYRLYWRDPSCLDGLGGMVCLSDEQAAYMKTITSCPILTIRHGVNLSFFQPAIQVNPCSPPKLLIVGQWLRDFETLYQSVKIISQHLPSVELDCVIPRFARESLHLLRLARLANVRWHSQLSAAELRRLYQEATLLFLPLLDATANNSIVEALACGLPIITSAVGGISAYVKEPFGKLCVPGDPQSHADAALAWLMDPDRLSMRRNEARLFAERYLDWKPIAESVANKFGL